MTASVPNSAAQPGSAPAAGQADQADNAALRADIRRLGDLLGETLVRQEGAEVLGLVEQVRLLSRTDGEATAELLANIDLDTAAKLVRAFSTYFHLANVTEQVHRGREFAARRAARARCWRRPPTSSPRPTPSTWPTPWRIWRSARSSPPTRPRRPAAAC